MNSGDNMDVGFLNGIYYVKTESMLKEDDFNTLKRLGRSLFFRYLKTKDYGLNSNYETIDKIIEKELLNVIEELNNTTNNHLITDAFFIDNTLTNIKIAYKEVRENVVAKNFSTLSRVNKEALLEFFKYGNLKLLPLEHQELFKEINKIDLSHEIQNYLQAVEKVTYNYYSRIIKQDKKYDCLNDYLEQKKVINNLLTFLKFKKRNENINELKDALLEENIIGIDTWLDIYSKNKNEVANKLFIYFNERILTAIDIFLNEGKIDELEEELTEYLTDKIKILSYNSDTLGPIIYYLHLKVEESLKVREYYYEKA